MTKERFIEGYGVPTYTVGVGGSGGAIQQYVYAQRHPGVIIDAAIPQYSYPDMVTQTIHVGDCELLEHFMDVTDGANPKWSTWTNRTWLEGMASSATRPNPYRGGAPGNTECINGWRGLTPLALNPLFGTAGSGAEFYNPAEIAAIKWTHWDDLRNVYGVDADGYAKVPWDNVGVQYGLSALKSGNITPAEFLKLNATVGAWKEGKDMVQEGCPFISALCAIPAQFDPWSRRNMRLSPDGGVTPAARREGNMDAANAAYTSGIVFRGAIDIPIIDWRHYLEAELDMHNSHQSFASRKRMLNHDGDASNQVIWFTDARPARAFDQTPLAFEVMDEWMANIRANPDSTVWQRTSRPLRSTRASRRTARSWRRAPTSGPGSSTRVPPARAPRRSRLSRPPASSRAGRSRAASSSARGSRSRRRWPTARTHRGFRPPPT